MFGLLSVVVALLLLGLMIGLLPIVLVLSLLFAVAWMLLAFVASIPLHLMLLLAIAAGVVWLITRPSPSRPSP